MDARASTKANRNNWFCSGSAPGLDHTADDTSQAYLRYSLGLLDLPACLGVNDDSSLVWQSSGFGLFREPTHVNAGKERGEQTGPLLSQREILPWLQEIFSMSMPSVQPAKNWSDKRWLWLFSPAVPVAFTGSLAAFAWSGQWWCLLFAPVFVHLLMPLLDVVFGEDFSNPPESEVAQLEQDVYYRALVWAYVPFQIAGTVFGAWLATTQALPWYAFAALVLSVGSFNGIGIATAHELGHKKEALDRWLAKIALAPTLYGHFYVEHNRGHHKRVATPQDPASSRMGESFWAFLPRTVLGSLRSAWDIERERLNRQGKSVWSIDNDNLQAWASSLVLYGCLAGWLGWPVLLFLVLQGVYGASMLEVVNYVEHYGLLREKDRSNRYVRCQPAHSWNSNHIVGNVLLYHLQRHSDHHAHPARRYQALRHFDAAPQLPAGYATMITAAYFPPLWFALMDHRVVAHYAGDLSKINMQPSARQKIFQRWHTAKTAQQDTAT